MIPTTIDQSIIFKNINGISDLKLFLPNFVLFAVIISKPRFPVAVAVPLVKGRLSKVFTIGESDNTTRRDLYQPKFTGSIRRSTPILPGIRVQGGGV